MGSIPSSTQMAIDFTTTPRGLCQCGCGQPTKIETMAGARSGVLKGEYRRYIRGHTGRFPRKSPPNPETVHPLCECGCGTPTNAAPQTVTKLGYAKGQPLRFVNGHQSRGLYGAKGSGWKGGRREAGGGYVMILCRDHPHANRAGYVMEHRLVMERVCGRFLEPQEVVHHKGVRFPQGSVENKRDNLPDNLELLANQAEHVRRHALYYRDATHKECALCRRVLPRTDFSPGRRCERGDPHYSRCRACHARLARERTARARTRS